MSPAVSMDDVEDPEMRQLLCQHMYTTEWGKATQESEVKNCDRVVGNTTVETGGDPVTPKMCLLISLLLKVLFKVRLKVDLLPPLPKSFRDKGKRWEDKQNRASVDPTKTFWINKDPPVK